VALTQEQVGSIEDLLRELQREVGALSTLARVRNSAALSAQELQVVQQALAPLLADGSDADPAQMQNALHNAIRELASRGCQAPQLLALARSVLEGTSTPGASEQPGQEGTPAEAEHAARSAAAGLVSSAVTAVVQDSLGVLKSNAGDAESVASALRSLDNAVACLEADSGAAGPSNVREACSAAVAALRQQVWRMLLAAVQDACGSADTAAGSAMLRLIASLAPDALLASR
jgi:hypothetical protein